jgi:hypothetical protein
MQDSGRNAGLGSESWHESLTTTFGSYGKVTPDQQRDLVRNVGKWGDDEACQLDRLAVAMLERMKAQ